MICQLCGRKNIKRLKRVERIDIFECKDCRLGFVDQKQTKKLNPQEKYNLEGYKENEKKLRSQFERIADKIYKYKKEGKVLDIGAGYGLLSSILYENGYEIEIIEPENTPDYLRGKKFKHYKTTIEKFLGKQKGKYDIILLMDVIEHLKDPLRILKRLKFFLNRGGIVVIQTPNYKSLMAKICKNWSWWMVSDHKFFFSPKSIHALLKKARFAVSELETYENLQDFKKNLDGNFSSIQNHIARKIIKGLFYTCFFSIYILSKKVIWLLGRGGLILTISV